MDLFRFIGHRWDHSIYYCLPNENNLKVPFAVKVTIALLPRIDAYRQRIGEKFGNEYISFDNNITLLSVFFKKQTMSMFYDRKLCPYSTGWWYRKKVCCIAKL